MLFPRCVEDHAPRFKEIFDKAGHDLDDDINNIGVVGHKGPHPEEYHLAVYRRLVEAVRGKEGEGYKKAFKDEMERLREDVIDPEHRLNKLLCKR